MSIRQAKMKNIGILIHLSVCVIILFIIVEAQPPPPRGGNFLFNQFPNGVWNLVQCEFNAKGQIISECPYEIIVWTKIPTKKLPRFLPKPLRRGQIKKFNKPIMLISIIRGYLT